MCRPPAPRLLTPWLGVLRSPRRSVWPACARAEPFQKKQPSGRSGDADSLRARRESEKGKAAPGNTSWSKHGPEELAMCNPKCETSFGRRLANTTLWPGRFRSSRGGPAGGLGVALGFLMVWMPCERHSANRCAARVRMARSQQSQPLAAAFLPWRQPDTCCLAVPALCSFASPPQRQGGPEQ